MRMMLVGWDKAAPAAASPPNRRENGGPARAALAGPTLLLVLALSNLGFPQCDGLSNLPASFSRRRSS